MSSNPQSIAIESDRIVTPTGVLDGTVVLSDGDIAAVNGTEQSAAECQIDANGRVVLPGLVDIHGDDFERHLFPREGVEIEDRTAIGTTARCNLTVGITTKFHAVAFEHDPEKNRTPSAARRILNSIHESETFVGDHRVHARCDITDPDCVDTVTDAVAAFDIDLVSITSDVRGKGQFDTERDFIDWYGQNRGNRRRSALSPEKARQLLDRRPTHIDGLLTERIERVSNSAGDAGAVLASHDDESAREVEGLSQNGVELTEFPATMEACQKAHERGIWTVMGAPNLVENGSLFGNLDTRSAIESDIVDILCVDYHPPSLLASVFVDSSEPLYKRVNRVTRNPADAVGLHDRGRIERGARADVLIVDPSPIPTVDTAFLEGRPISDQRKSRR
jgi:alpha-D-ribose 1-methylphosphonate 5-triphosphate diphosphatase